jgi:hypothetical protein
VINYTHWPSTNLKPRLQAKATHRPPSQVDPPLTAPVIVVQLSH